MVGKNTQGDIKTVPYFIVWQSMIWIRFLFVSPLLVMLTVLSLYLLGFRSWELVIDTLIIMGIATIVVWWLWMVYTIATIAYMIEKSSGRLRDVLTDIQEMKTEIKSFGYNKNNLDP